MKDESKVTDAAPAVASERGRDRRAGRGIGILLAAVAAAGATGFATWYSRYDAPLERGAEPEWMAEVSEDSVGALIGSAKHERKPEFPGVNNARDIGGYPTYDGRTTRWGTVFRSGRLKDLSEEGCERFRKTGIRTVIDLRNRMVADSSLFDGDPECVQAAANMKLFRFIPPRGEYETKAAHTRALVERNRNTICGVMETLAEEEYLPLLYHCTAGRDRAGIITYVLLDLLGVDRRVIRAEYDLSGEVGKTHEYEGIDAIFADIDAEGGIHEYLKGMDVSYTTQRRVRGNLLE